MVHAYPGNTRMRWLDGFGMRVSGAARGQDQHEAAADFAGPIRSERKLHGCRR